MTNEEMRLIIVRDLLAHGRTARELVAEATILLRYIETGEASPRPMATDAGG